MSDRHGPAPRTLSQADELSPRAFVSLVVAAFSLSMALDVRNGRLDPVALVFLILALVFTVGAFRASFAPARLWDRLAQTPDAALALAVAISLAVHPIRPPAIHLDVVGFSGRAAFTLGLTVVAALLALAWTKPARWVRIATPVILGLHFLLGVWVIRHSPTPDIDVFVFQRDAVAAFLAGENPYGITYPDIYGNKHAYYGPGMSVGGRLNFGFLYPPLSLFMAVPGVVLGGDFRYSQLFALGATGALMAALRGGRQGLFAAALYLFAPRTFFVLEQGWTEPYVVALLALVVFCLTRGSRLSALAFALFLVSKQYLVFMLPLAFLAFSRRAWRQAGRPPGWAAWGGALAIAAAVSLPLPLGSWGGFWKSVVAMQFHQPFRDDALSFLAALAYVTSLRLPSLVAFVAAGVAIAVALRRTPRSPAGFAAATALVYFAFVAFNKQAFCNYYFFVLGSMTIALAAWRRPTAATPP